MLQTGSASYDLDLSDDGVWFTTEIDYTFTNRTGGNVSLTNCNGAFSVALEQYVDGVWELTWAPFIPYCLSSPIVIESGAIFAHTLRVIGARPGGRKNPQFRAFDNPSGTYRMAGFAGFHSNAFDLVVQ